MRLRGEVWNFTAAKAASATPRTHAAIAQRGILGPRELVGNSLRSMVRTGSRPANLAGRAAATIAATVPARTARSTEGNGTSSGPRPRAVTFSIVDRANG